MEEFFSSLLKVHVYMCVCVYQEREMFGASKGASLGGPLKKVKGRSGTKVVNDFLLKGSN